MMKIVAAVCCLIAVCEAVSVSGNGPTMPVAEGELWLDGVQQIQRKLVFFLWERTTHAQNTLISSKHAFYEK